MSSLLPPDFRPAAPPPEPFAGSAHRLFLPLARRTPAAPAGRLATQEVPLPGDLPARLRALAGEVGLPVDAVLLAAFQTLLHRYSLQEEVTVAASLPAAAGGAIRLVRGAFTAEPSFRALARHLRDGLAAQGLPAEGGSPTFPALFLVRHPTVADLNKLTWNPESGSPARFGLTLIAEPSADGLRALLSYNTDLFAPEVIARMADHLARLLEGIAATPDRPLTELPLLGEAERRQLLEEWNATAAPFAADACVHHLFEAHAAARPDHPALEGGGARLTYGELNARANQLAHHLASLGAGPDVLIGVCLRREPDLIVTLLAVLKAGAAYVPLDPDYPADRLAFMVRDSRMRLLVTHTARAERFRAEGVHVIALDAEAPAIAARPTDPPAVAVGPTNLVYCIYTSGSTGTPKGVLLEHRALVNFVQAVAPLLNLTPADRQLQFSSVSFDASALEIFPALAAGAAVVLRDDEMLGSVPRFLQACQTLGVTALFLPVAFWHEVTVALEKEGAALPPALRLVYVGGEKVQPDRVAAWRAKVGPAVRLLNLYGPTEAAIAATAADMTVPDLPPEVPIGKPLANYRCYVLDRFGQPTPRGVPGELHIGGVGLARGYLGRDELTAQKFVPDPFAGRDGARMYKTGDLVYYLPDGQLTFLGRVDHQVKIRGFRIELGEIEALLARHPEVQEALVVARADASGQQALVAYVIPRPGAAARPADLRRHLVERLPGYMVPPYFVAVGAWPLTPNGKIDRRALPEPGPADAGQAEGGTAPRDDLERTLCAIWEEVLGMRPVGVHDNFFTLGGHSLWAARLFAEIEAKLGRALPLRQLFSTPTVAGLAGVLRSAPEAAGPASTVVPIRPEGTRPPVSFLAGIGGHVFTFRQLAQLLSPDQPCFGLEAPGADGGEVPPDRIEAWASRHLADLKAVQPRGPYYLAGYSSGGVVAFEMARQLRAAGEKVGLVALFDAPAPDYPRPLPLPRRVVWHARHFLGLSTGAKVAYLRQRIANTWDKVLRRFGVYTATTTQSLGHVSAALGRIEVALRKAHDHYRPKPYAGDVVLFRAAVHEEWPATDCEDPEFGWRPWVRGAIEVYEAPGAHLAIFDAANVAVWGPLFRACLERAQGERGA